VKAARISERAVVINEIPFAFELNDGMMVRIAVAGHFI
jgi:hypothetical protein